MSDDYVIGAAIGDGLMGPRYAGRYRPSGHPVALEEVPPALLGRREFVERLAAAGRQAASITDSHVVALYDLVRLGPRLYVVTELVRARNLAALLGAEPTLPAPAALLVLDSVLAGLQEIHGAGISHGDVCPDAVVVTQAGTVRLADVGVAMVLAADPSMPSRPAVQPPEGGIPSPAADLFAAGALLRELLSGLRPEQTGDWPDPDRLGELVRRSLAPEPDRRFPSALEFRRELEGVAAERLGSGWQVKSDLAARATRPLGPQPPRRRAERTVTLRLDGEPDGSAGVEPSALVGGETPPVGPPLPWSLPPPAPGPPPAGAAGTPPVFASAAAVGPDPFEGSGGPWASPGSTPYVPQRSRNSAPRRPHRGRRAAVILVALLVVAAAVAAVLLLTPLVRSSPPASTPLRVGDDVRLTVQPGTSGGCDSTFTFTATGSLSGTGRLTYRWIKSVAGSTPVYDQYTVTVARGEGTFRFTTPLELTGQATLASTVTFQVLSPSAPAQSETVHYTCTH
jgi:serine/threonine protein kinase